MQIRQVREMGMKMFHWVAEAVMVFQAGSWSRIKARPAVGQKSGDEVLGKIQFASLPEDERRLVGQISDSFSAT